MNAPLEKQYLKLIDSITVLGTFLKRFGDQIPEGLGGIDCSTCYDKPIYSVSLGHRTGDQRDRALQVLGEIFGTDGWHAKPDYSGRAFDWSKQVDGVNLMISGAETLPKLEPMPVPVNKWPIMLEEATE